MDSARHSAWSIECAAGHGINRLHRHRDNYHVCDESYWHLDEAAKMKDSDEIKKKEKARE
jgi:hypothetical protein